MSIPTSREEFKERCLRDLGAPVIKINIADEQLEDKIDDALGYWRDYHHEAVERKFLATQLSATNVTQGYITLPDNVIGVSRVLPLRGGILGAGNTDVLSAEYQFTYNVLRGGTDGMTQFYILNTYLQTVQEMFEHRPLVEFRRYKGQLSLNSGFERWVEADYIVAEVLCYLKEDDLAKVWGDRMLRKYAVALMKKQWGENISKFAGMQLPGGMTLDGPRIIEEAIAEIDKLESDFINKWAEPDQFYMG